MVRGANFGGESTLFRDLLSGVSEKRFLTIQGKSLVGKTTFLAECAQLCKACNCSHAEVNLKCPKDPHAVLDYLYEQLGPDNFPQYRQYSEKVALGGSNFSISKTIVVLSKIIRLSSKDLPYNHDAQYRQLTINFFQDMARLAYERTVIFLFDHYEQLNLKTKDWMLLEFLPRLYRLPRLFAVVAGQDVPYPDVQWQHIHQHIVLDVRPVDYWERYVAENGVPLSREEIAMLYTALDGVTGLMAIKIQKLKGMRC